MSLYLPKMLSDTVFEVEVNTELNKQYLNDNSYSILSFLREKLQNGEISMTIKIAEGNAIKKKHSPPVRYLMRWYRKTPHSKNFLMSSDLN